MIFLKFVIANAKADYVTDHIMIVPSPPGWQKTDVWCPASIRSDFTSVS